MLTMTDPLQRLLRLVEQGGPPGVAGKKLLKKKKKTESPVRKRQMLTEIESCNNVGKGLATPTNDNCKRSRKHVVPYQPGTANNQKSALFPSLPLSDESVVKKLQPTALPVDKEGFIEKRIAKQDPSKANFYGDVCSIKWDNSKKKRRHFWVVKWGEECNLGCHGVSEMNNYCQCYLSLPAEEDPKYRPQKDKRGGD